MVGVGMLWVASSVVPAAAKPFFASGVADYMPASVGGKRVVIDPSSTAGTTTPSCSMPAEGVAYLPLVNGAATLAQEVFGGIWDCPTAVGTGFVVGLDAAEVGSSTPKLTKKTLYAPPVPADAGSVRAVTVKVRGRPVTVYLLRLTVKAGGAAVPTGTVLEVASAEPKPHLLVAATTRAGVKPLRYLTAMLKAGAGTIPRAG